MGGASGGSAAKGGGTVCFFGDEHSVPIGTLRNGYIVSTAMLLIIKGIWLNPMKVSPFLHLVGICSYVWSYT
jgi:hypothetical protein